MARILIVDDSAAMRLKMKSILAQDGHIIVSEAANGVQAYREYAEHLPDLVTMDVTMPLLDGIEAVKRIIDVFPNARIIMVSSISHKPDVFTALYHGAKHYILKPIEPAKIIEIVNKVLTDPSAHIKTPLFKTTEAINNQTELTKHFSFETNDGILLINLSKDISHEDIKSLNSTMQELLTSEHGKVILNFGTMENIDKEVLIDITTIIDFFKNTNKEIKVVAENDTFRILLKYRKLNLLNHIYSCLKDVTFL